MSYAVDDHELDDLRNRFCDQLDVHPLQDWSPALLNAAIALVDLHFAEGGTNMAPVLELVKTGGTR